VIQTIAIIVSFAGVIAAGWFALMAERRRQTGTQQAEAFRMLVAGWAASAHRNLSDNPLAAQHAGLVDVTQAKALLLTYCDKPAVDCLLQASRHGFVGSDEVVVDAMTGLVNALRVEAGRKPLEPETLGEILFRT
jgi:hypothetical protein